MYIIEMHLILNHVPILGVAFVSVYLLIATIFKNTFMQKVSLWILLCVALLTITVYFSGLGAETPVKTLPNVSKAYLQLHEKVARIASMTIWAIGGITLLGLVLLRGREQLFKYLVRGILAMTLLSTGLFILTGYLGGQITHSEIRSPLAKGLSTRSITLGVVAIMLVIVVAMIVPVLLHRRELFKKTEKTIDRSMHWQRQQHQGKHSSWPQTWQQAGENTQLYWSDASAPVAQSLSQPSGGASLPLLGNATGDSQRQSLPAQEQQNGFSYGTGKTRPWTNSWLQGISFPAQSSDSAADDQLAFLSSQPQKNGQPGFSYAILGELEDRPLIEENTRPLPIATAPIRRLNRRKKLLVGLSLFSAVILMGGLGFALLHVLKHSPLPLQIITDIPLSGNPNRFDYQNFDPHTKLLYLTHSASNTVTIFDTGSKRIVADVGGIRDVHAIAIAPDLGRVFATSATDNQVVVLAEQSHTILARIGVGDSPDGLIYEQSEHKVFVAEEAGHNEAVLDARTLQRIAEIPLGGAAGDLEYDARSHRILAVVATLNQLVSIDPVTDTIRARAGLPGCQSGQDLVLDELQRLAFVDCADNASLLMVDLDSMRVLSSQPVGNQPDLMALDSSWHYLYVASESGVLSVFDEHRRTFRKVNEGFVAPAAHTLAVDPASHYLYLPLQNVGGRPILRIALFHP
jgi:DNA-binding beta-propeller fold protein YncE